jgi:hypothetical protein
MDERRNWTPEFENQSACVRSPREDESLQPPMPALRSNELLDGVGKIGQWIHQVSVLLGPLDKLLNVISLFLRKIRLCRLFLDGSNEFPKARSLFPVSNKFGDKFGFSFALLCNAPFFFSFALLFPLPELRASSAISSANTFRRLARLPGEAFV